MATTVAQYLKALPAERRAALEVVRAAIRANLDDDYEEGIQYGMIGYYVPHRVFPAGYHCDPKQPLPFCALASQAKHMALYLHFLYMNPADDARFRAAWQRTGKKLDMGKACLRFRAIDDLALDVIGAAVARMPTKRYVEQHEAWLVEHGRAPRKPAKATKPAKPAKATKPAKAKRTGGA